MNEVGRKRKRVYTTKQKALALLAVMALLGGLWFALLRPEPLPSPASLRSDDGGKQLLYSTGMDKIASLTIKPSMGRAYTLLRQGERFVAADNEGFPLDEDAVNGMLANVLHILTLSDFGELEAAEADMEELGFGEDTLYVSIASSGADDFAFRIGHRIPADIPQDYLMVEGSARLYGIDTDLRYALDRSLMSLHPVPRLNFNADLLDSYSAMGQGAELSLERLSADHWEMTKPYRYPVSTERLEQLLDRIADMRLASYVAPADDASLEAYGLNEPRLRVTMHLSQSEIKSYDDEGQLVKTLPIAAQRFVFEIGHDLSSEGFYCRYLDGIYQASHLSMGFMLKTAPEAYEGLVPIDIPLSEVRYIRFEGAALPPQAYDIALVEHVLPNVELATDSYGNQLYDYQVSSEGREVDAEAFAAFYARLMQLSAFSRLPEGAEPASEPPVLRISLRYAERGDREIVFYPYDPLHLRMEINGIARHLVQMSTLEPILAALGDAAVHNAPAQTNIP